MSTMTTSSSATAVGSALPRIEGARKVSGQAHYTADIALPGMLHAVPVGATIAAGTLLELDTRAARAMPGVREVFTRFNIGPLQRLDEDADASIDERRPPLADDEIRYYGQYVALVVADTFERATAAARAVRATYHARAPDVDMELVADDEPDVDASRGDPDAAFASGEVTIDAVYRTPPETHNAIELHATLADFDGRDYTVYETSQGVVNARAVIAAMLGVAPARVRVVTEYLGSGFGGKLWPWTHTLLAVAAARQLQVPVKLVLDRKTCFETVGHRANTRQRLRLSATRDGRLTSLQQDYLYHCARIEKSKEECGEATPYLYSTPHLRVTSGHARRDVGANTSMRGPGAVPGLFAVESAMDELAIALGMDPVELRLRNEPEIDEDLGVPFSSRHLRACYARGAEAFGWSRRDPAVGSMRRDGVVLGWGMAAASWMAQRLAAKVALQLGADGRVRVSTGSQDIGTGTYTVLAQTTADVVGVPVERVEVRLGDTRLPDGPLSGGSMATASLVPAVMVAAQHAFEQLVALADARGDGAMRHQATAGRVHARGADPESGRDFGAVLRDAGVEQLTGEGSSGPSKQDAGADKVSIHSYAAHFVEVSWQPQIARLRVERVVTVIDAGRIINPRTGRNQVEGAVMMGIGMALLEETEYDTRSGAPINANLADYLVVTHADAPEVDVHFIEEPDLALNSLGARGIGEIGIAGVAPAIAAAVHHATGVRVRKLPIRIEDLLGAGRT